MNALATQLTAVREINREKNQLEKYLMEDQPRRFSSNEPIPAKLSWPTPEWRSEYWWTFFSWLIAALLLLFPELENNFAFKDLRIYVALFLIIMPFLTPIGLWLARVIIVAISRIRIYPQLYQESLQEVQASFHLKEDMFQLINRTEGIHLIEILRASHQAGKLYIALSRSKGKLLHATDKLSVIDTQDNRIMGMFEITEVRTNEYLAVGTSGIDALWSGFVQQQGEVSINPNLIAVFVSQGEHEDDSD